MAFTRLSCLAALLLSGLNGVFAQSYNPVIDVQHYGFDLVVSDTSDKIVGHTILKLTFKQAADSFWLDLGGLDSTGKGMKVLYVANIGGPGDEGRQVRFSHKDHRLTIYGGGHTGDTGTYLIDYEGIPSDGLIIAKNKYGHRGFFGDNWPNRAHHWLPCVDDPSDKAMVDFMITAPEHYTVVANGALVEEVKESDGTKRTIWKESVPISPKIMVAGISDFAVDHPGDTLGVPVYNYVYPEDKVAGFQSYALALRILPFYISHIGPYPFEKCGNVQSKTRFGGLENASAIFYYENSVRSPGVESLMAHEIAHQWFGDAATETTWLHLWLSEGFATYMAHCYLGDRYGIDTLFAGMIKDKKKIFAFEKERFTPVVDSSVKDNYMQLLNPNSYEKGSWVLHMLRNETGDETFWKGIAAYYAAYRNKNASSVDFEKIMEDVSGKDLHTFFHQWLYTPGHPIIRISWHINPKDSSFTLEYAQKQPALFEFTIPLHINRRLIPLHIKDRTGKIRLDLPEVGLTIFPVPDYQVLAEVELVPPSATHPAKPIATPHPTTTRK